MSSKGVLVRGESVVRLHRRWIFHHHQLLNSDTETRERTGDATYLQEGTDQVGDADNQDQERNRREELHPFPAIHTRIVQCSECDRRVLEHAYFVHMHEFHSGVVSGEEAARIGDA